MIYLQNTLTHVFNMGWASATTSSNNTNSLCFPANGKVTVSNWRDYILKYPAFLSLGSRMRINADRPIPVLTHRIDGARHKFNFGMHNIDQINLIGRRKCNCRCQWVASM